MYKDAKSSKNWDLEESNKVLQTIIYILLCSWLDDYFESQRYDVVSIELCHLLEDTLDGLFIFCETAGQFLKDIEMKKFLDEAVSNYMVAVFKADFFQTNRPMNIPIPSSGFYDISYEDIIRT